MKILLVNKFLYPRGGAETYLIKLGAHLTERGHEVQYFGMSHPKNTVGNAWNIETAPMDFHDGSSMTEKLSYPFKIIRSKEANRKMRTLLHAFSPDVVHVNNFNYQLTPSILEAAEAYRTEKNSQMRILYTAHDSQLVCPGHLLYNAEQHTVCEACLGGHYGYCIKNRCIHGSVLRSALGTYEARYWKRRNIYRVFDAILCPSAFMKRILDTDPLLRGRTVVLRNFVERRQPPVSNSIQIQGEPLPSSYVLYFGRYAEEKGIRTLIRVCTSCKDIPFVFAGDGPLAPLLSDIPNVRNVGFLDGEALGRVIAGAAFTVCPSECNENCPFSVMESIMAGVPVLGAMRGGIPELIEEGKTGWLFEAGNAAALQARIRQLWDDGIPDTCHKACKAAQFDDLSLYGEKLLAIYKGRITT